MHKTFGNFFYTDRSDLTIFVDYDEFTEEIYVDLEEYPHILHNLTRMTVQLPNKSIVDTEYYIDDNECIRFYVPKR